MTADWMADALCASRDPELWFPGTSGSSLPAIRICRQCPVRLPCLRYACQLRLATADSMWGGGVWGGRHVAWFDNKPAVTAALRLINKGGDPG